MNKPALAQTAKLALIPVVNGVEAEEAITVLVGVDGKFSASRSDLAALGVPQPRGSAEEIALDILPGVSTNYDAARQTLSLVFETHDKRRNRIDLAPHPDAAPITRSATGLVFNYDVVANRARANFNASGLFEGRFFSPIGTVSTSALANTGQIVEQDHIVRLDSTYTVTDIDRLRRYSAGDIITGGLPSSRSVRIVGLQATTDFSVRPDLITYPVPTLSGSAAVPSTLDVLVNGSRVGSGQVAPGEFAVAGAPIINGSGTVDIVLRDALGRQTRSSFTVYGVRTLLAPGLSACTLDLGAVRRGYAIRSDDYRFIAGTATCRAGLNPAITIEGHTEATGDLGLAGGGAVFGLGRFGVASLDLSASTADTRLGAMRGGQLAIGYELIARPLSVNLSAVRSTRGYRDVAARSGDEPARSSLLALIGFDLRRLGSLSLGFTRLDGSPSIGPREQAFRQRADGLATVFTRASLATATYSVTLGRGLNLYANALHDFDRSRSTVAVFGLSIQLGRRATANVSVTGGDQGMQSSAQVIRQVSAPGDFGYRALVDRGQSSRELAEATYRGSWGEVTAGLQDVSGQIAARVGARGSVVLAAGGLFAGNTINRSFAVIDAGLPNISVTRDHRPAGRTGARGRLIVPDLRDFESNELAIDPLSLPDDALSASTDVIVRPRDRTGVVARFGVRYLRAATIHIVDARGAPLAPGGRARLNGASSSVPVGYDGAVYGTGLLDRNRVDVLLSEGGVCTAFFDYPNKSGATPGPIVCR